MKIKKLLNYIEGIQELNEYSGNICFAGIINFSELKALSVDEAKRKVINEIQQDKLIFKNNKSFNIDNIDFELYKNKPKNGLYLPSMTIMKSK